MKVSALILNTLIVMMEFITVVHSAEYYPFVLFNGGSQDTRRKCTDTEWAYIDTEIEKGYSSRRGLESVNGTRSLATICKKPLSNFFGNGCPAQTTSEPVPPVRNLRGLQVAANICDAATAKFNTVLNTISTRVSSTCKAMLAARSFSCRRRVACDIGQIDVWDGDTERLYIADFPLTGGKICQSLKVSFSPVTDFTIGDVYFELTGSNGYRYNHREWRVPYFLFGDVPGDVIGRFLDPATYTLFVYSALDPTVSKTVEFTVERC